MIRRILRVTIYIALISTGCSCGSNREHNDSDATQAKRQQKVQSMVAIVDSFARELAVLERDYPEFKGFAARDPELQSALEVRFSRGEGPISEMRGVRASDISPYGVSLHFLVRAKDNPVWTEYDPDTLISLDNLGLDLYSEYVLSENATPGLQEKLAALFVKYRQLLQMLNKKGAIGI